MAKYTITLTESIHPVGIRMLEERGCEVVSLPSGSDEGSLKEVAPASDALITRGGIKVTCEIMASSPKLKAVGVHGIGCDHVDLEAARELNKVVLNTPTALTETVAFSFSELLESTLRREIQAKIYGRSFNLLDLVEKEAFLDAGGHSDEGCYNVCGIVAEVATKRILELL